MTRPDRERLSSERLPCFAYDCVGVGGGKEPRHEAQLRKLLCCQMKA